MKNLEVGKFYERIEFKDVTSKLFLTFFAVAVSFSVLLKYIGIFGVICYALFFYLVLNNFEKFKIGKVIQYSFFILTLALPIIFAKLYPTWDYQADRDEALIVAVKNLVNFKYPYLSNTPPGNPISPMPGLVFLAIPFALIEEIEIFNFVSIFLFLFVVKVFYGEDIKSKILLLIILIPAIWHEIIFKGDLIANSFISLSAILIILDAQKRNLKNVGFLLLGVIISSRFNYVFLFPFLAVFIFQNKIIENKKDILIPILVFLLITAPFAFFYNEFTPLHTLRYAANNNSGMLEIILIILTINFVLFAVMYILKINKKTNLFLIMATAQFTILFLPFSVYSNYDYALMIMKDRHGVIFVLLAILYFVSAKVISKPSINQ